MTFELFAGPEPNRATQLASWHIYQEQRRTWMASKMDMRAKAAHVANEWVLACDHAGEIQRAIEELPIE